MALYLGSQKISSVITAYGTTTFDTSDATALARHIQLGYTAYVDGKKITGTMDPGPDTIKTGVTIAGVTGTFTSDATAGASEIKKGYTAYVNGTKITGSYELDPTIIQAGVTVDGVTGTFTSDANATAAQIQSGKTAYVNGVKITGTLAPAAANIKTGVTIAGVTGTFTSDATATAAMIQSGYTAYVNGSKITGTLAPASSNIKVGATIAGVAGTFTSDATATAARILNGYTAYVNGSKVTGTALSTSTTATAAYIRNGYTAYNNSGTLLTGTMAEQTASGYTYITPSTTSAQSKSFAAGYYPNSHGVYVYAASGGSQVVTGTINASSNVYTISTSFTPKGFMMVSNSYYFDGDLNTLNLYALNSTTVSGYYEQYSSGTGEQTIAVSMYLHSAYHPLYDSYPTSDYGSGIIYTAGITSDLYASVLDAEVTDITGYAVSWFTEDSTLWVGDLGWSAYMSEDTGGVEAYAASATVVYSATAATITVSSSLFCPPMTYVCWG